MTDNCVVRYSYGLKIAILRLVKNPFLIENDTNLLKLFIDKIVHNIVYFIVAKRLSGGVYMQSVTVRISSVTHKKLRALSASTGESMQSIIDRALEELRRKDFWERTNAAFAALQSDPVAWKAEQKERSSWDITLADGLKEQ